MIDTELVTEAILSTGCSPIAITEGAELVEAWINEFAGLDALDEVIAVECGFSIQLDDLTWVIGVQDLIASDNSGIYGFEFKTTKGPSKWWTESQWLDSIRNGPQIAVYALALNRGVFYENGMPFVLRTSTPVRERVRAVVKTAVPTFWPRDPKDAWQEFDNLSLSRVADAFRVKAETIRAARRTGLVPFQLPGRQCTDFNRLCSYYDECTGGCIPKDTPRFDRSDPAASLALPFLPDEARRPGAVIISASSYQTYTRCMELGRREAMSEGKEESLALDVGTVTHAGLASLYRQIKESQKKLDIIPANQ